MRIPGLVVREIAHRRASFLHGVLAVLVAVALVVGGWTLLRSHGELTERLVEKKETVVAARNAELSDAMRRITKQMGFNVVILPKGQNLDDPFAADYASKVMPEEYADRLAASDLVTVNHLLPTLERRTEWPERNGRTLFLVGIKGQVPQAHRDPRKPIMQPVPARGIVLGSYLASEESLAPGDRVRLLGEDLEVTAVHPRRGDKRDRTAWIDLDLMQRLFDQEDRINAIWALECSCAMADVGKVREELGRILPDVEIEEQGEKALARAEARKKAAEIAEASLAAERDGRERLLALGSRFRVILVPLIIVSAGIWLALLVVGNVRERRDEIGILRALGHRSIAVASLFLSRAVLCGLLGAVPGYALGYTLGVVAFTLSAGVDGAMPAPETFDVRVLVWVVVLAPLLSALACWLPAVAAAQEDPAVVLRAE